MDAQFKKLLMNHPEDIVQIIDGQLEMVLLQKNLDHPLATYVLFSLVACLLFVCLSVCLSVCLFVCMFVCCLRADI
jgi:hypothetical protein